MIKRGIAAVSRLVAAVFRTVASAVVLPLVFLPWLGYVFTRDLEAVQGWIKFHDFLWFAAGVSWFLVIFMVVGSHAFPFILNRMK